MKFRLSTFILVLSLLVVSIGWITERRFYSRQLSNTLDDAGAVSSTISTAFFTNLIYSELDERTHEENANRRNSLLHSNIVHLFVNLDDTRFTQTKLGRYTTTRDERAISIQHAGKSLALLGLLDVKTYLNAHLDVFGTDGFYDGLLSPNGESLTPEFERFVTEAINQYNDSQ